MAKSNGAVVYEGPSALDGAPIVVVVTGLRQGSVNRKTGDLIQTWIVRADLSPVDAVRGGADVSICGNCRHRGAIVTIRKRGRRRWRRERSCYVDVGKAPLSVWRCYQRGGYPRVTDPREIAALGAGRVVRVGSYGDPAATPAWLWGALVSRSFAHRGYTHQWAAAPGLREICMASVDTVEEGRTAQALGWRTFRVRSKRGDRMRGEARCPASKEAGFKATCESCPIGCAGTSDAAPNVVILSHGSGAGNFNRSAA